MVLLDFQGRCPMLKRPNHISGLTRVNQNGWIFLLCLLPSKLDHHLNSFPGFRLSLFDFFRTISPGHQIQALLLSYLSYFDFSDQFIDFLLVSTCLTLKIHKLHPIILRTVPWALYYIWTGPLRIIQSIGEI